MTRPPITYPLTLADLDTLASIACTIDDFKEHLPENERAEAAAMVERLHDMVERAAGADALLIYPEEEAAA